MLVERVIEKTEQAEAHLSRTAILLGMLGIPEGSLSEEEQKRISRRLLSKTRGLAADLRDETLVSLVKEMYEQQLRSLVKDPVKEKILMHLKKVVTRRGLGEGDNSGDILGGRS